MDLHFDPLSNVESKNNSNSQQQNTTTTTNNFDETVSKAAESVTSYFKGWGSFSFSSIVETVKQKSDEIINIYKEDLQEFGSTIHQDTVNTFNGTTSIDSTVMASSPPRSQTNPSLTEMLSSKITSFIGEYPSPFDSGNNNNNNSPASLSSSPQITTSFDEVNRSLTTIDNTLYLADKNDKEYQTFKDNFQLANYKELIIVTLTSLDNNNISVQRNYNRLVPSKVTEFDFWCRYFYQEHVIKNQQQRRVQLINEAIKLDQDDENINWDDDEDDIINEIKSQSIILEKEKQEKLSKSTQLSKQELVGDEEVEEEEEIEQEKLEEELDVKLNIKQNDGDILKFEQQQDKEQHQQQQVNVGLLVDTTDPLQPLQPLQQQLPQKQDVIQDNVDLELIKPQQQQHHHQTIVNNQPQQQQPALIPTTSSQQPYMKQSGSQPTFSDWEVIDKTRSHLSDVTDEEEWSAWE